MKAKSISYIKRILFWIILLPVLAHAQYKHYVGNIAGNLNIVVDMFIKQNNEVQGKYYYTRVGQGIYLSGRKISKNVLQIQEYTNGNVTGKWTLYINGDKATGTWSGNNREFTISLTENYSQSIRMVHFNHSDGVIHNQNCKLTFDYDLYIAQPEQMMDKNSTVAERIATKILSAAVSINAIEAANLAVLRYLIKDKDAQIKQNYQSAVSSGSLSELPYFDTYCNWSKSVTAYPVFNQNNLLSYRCVSYEFLGEGEFTSGTFGRGAKIEKYTNISLSTGEDVKLQDIFSNPNDKNLFNLIENKVKELYGNERDIKVKYIQENFEISYGGLTFIYYPYEIGTYNNDIMTIYVPFKELQPYLKYNHPFSWIR